MLGCPECRSLVNCTESCTWKARHPTVEAPPLVPFVMSLEQQQFLALHARHLVTKWVWVFGGGTLRATADNGKGATISAVQLAEIVDAGLCTADMTGVRVTPLGGELVTT